MREHLYRGKRRDNGEWVYGSIIAGDYILQYIDLAQSWTPNTSDHKLTCRAYDIVPGTVSQYTGMMDSHKNKIFGGDLINLEDKYTYEVRFEDARFVCYHVIERYGKWGNLHRLSDPDFSDYEHKVIGNKWDNPEHLNQQP